MPIYEDVMLRLDERSARAVSDQIAAAAKDGSQAFERHFASGGLGGVMQRVGRDAGDSLNAGLRSGVTEAINGMTSQFGTFGKAAGSVLEAIPAKAALAAAGIGAIALGAVEAGKALYTLGKQWDDIADGITVRTGKVGADLENLTNIVGDVGKTTAASLGSIGDIVAQISQSMPDLAQNNAAVRQMASNLAYLDANGQSVDIRQLGMAFAAFGVDAGRQVQALDDLNSAAQATGIPINQLVSTVRAGAPQFKQFGLDIGSATGLLASFAQAGVAPEIAVTGLRTALKNVGGEGKDAAAGLGAAITQIKALHDAQQEGAAQQKAQDIFGTRNAAAFLQVIENGTLSVENLNKALSDTGQSIAAQQGATDDWAQSLEKIKNTISVGLKPIADTVFGSINEQLQWMAGNLGLADTKAKDLANSMAAAASVPITPDSALGRMLTPGGLAGSSTPGSATPGGVGNAVGGAPGAGLTLPGGLLAPQWGSHGVSPPGGSSSAAGGGTPAAQVPYGALPGIMPGVPLTPEVYSAQTSLWEANHSVEEKRARVQQLEADNTAKAEDLIAARNDAAKAERDQAEAQMRFAQTQQNAYEKQFKQLDKAASDLGQIGVQLDSDFGISKGLAGIVENITKMVAGLAAAPVIGALAGGQIGLGFRPGEAGTGLVGMLAGSGAFGSQFQAQPYGGATPSGVSYAGGGYTLPSALGPAALRPGPAARPGESARDFAHRAMMPFWQSQGYTVGDHAADQYGEHQRGALDIMVPNIGAGNSVLNQVLSDPNVYGAIFNNQTYGYGHGLTPQDYSAGHTGNPTQDHQDHVHAWYRPGFPGDLPGMVGSPGQGYPLPFPTAGGGPGVGATVLGGLPPPQGHGKGGLGPSGGGLLGAAIGAAQTAISAGGMAADVMGGGGGGSAGAAVAAAAMQIGIQEANRAIQFGGQVAGILTSGLMETFLPFGASELASQNWLTRIVGGVVGATPMLPNLAGGGKKTPEGLTPEQAAAYQAQQKGPSPEQVAAAGGKQHGGAAGQPPGPGNMINSGNTYNTTIQSSADTIKGSAKDFEWNTMTMNQAPGV